MKLNEYRDKIVEKFSISKYQESDVLQCILGMSHEMGNISELFIHKLLNPGKIKYEYLKQDTCNLLWYNCNLMNALNIKEEEIIKLKFYNYGLNVKENLLYVHFYLGELCTRQLLSVDGSYFDKDVKIMKELTIKIFLLMSKFCERNGWNIEDLFNEINLIHK